MSGKPAPSNRSFGLTVGGAFAVLSALAIWRHRPLLAEITGPLGAVLIVTALLRPSLLRIPSLIWGKISHALGWFNARLLLGGLFFVVLAPIGLWWRLRGKDPMGRTLTKWPGWSPRPARYADPQHFTKRY